MFFFKKRTPPPKITARDVDQDALSVIRRLQQAGYTAYLVGGGVRDLLLGRKPKDFDVVTDARPNQIKRLFRNAFIIGRRFKLVLIVFGKKQIETATFRRDPPPPDARGRRNADGALYQSSDNEFGTPEEDAFRRDFTVNALFWDSRDESIVDYTDGLRDLKNKTLRCIGDPEIRFREDPVRMLRAVRLSSRLGFTIHSDSVKAIARYASELSAASRPRLFEEMLRLFTFEHAEESFTRLHETGLMRHLLPDVDAYISRTGEKKSPAWKYFAAIDKAFPSFDVENRDNPRFVQENAIRLAVLLAPLLLERLEAAGERDELLFTISQRAREVVEEALLANFSTSGWRIPRVMCSDLMNILAFGVCRNERLSRDKRLVHCPWFHTALQFRHICDAVAPDRAAAAITETFDAKFAEYAGNPLSVRRGNYEPVDPDTLGAAGFPGDVPEDRDAIFPNRQPGAGAADGTAPRRRRHRRGGRRHRHHADGGGETA